MNINGRKNGTVLKDHIPECLECGESFNAFDNTIAMIAGFIFLILGLFSTSSLLNRILLRESPFPIILFSWVSSLIASAICLAIWLNRY